MSTEWMADAACKGQASLFFGRAAFHIAAAKVVCSTCPVVDECRAEWFAAREATGYSFPGVWFGTDETDRRYGRRPALHGTIARYKRGCTCVDCKAANARHAAAMRARRVAS